MPVLLGGGIIKAETTSGASSDITLEWMESNLPLSDFTGALISDSVGDSIALDSLPSPDTTSADNLGDWLYHNYDLQNAGPDASYWHALDMTFGALGISRTGIGFFYFYNSYPNPIIPTPVTVQDFTEEVSAPIKLWDWLTTFWNYLKDDDRVLFENFWHAMKMGADSLNKKAGRLITSGAPQESGEHVFEDFYEVQIGPLHSKPLAPDPTESNKNYAIRPVSKILIEPEYDDDLKPIYNDMVEISASDYYKIRTVGLNCYMVVNIKGSTDTDRYFKILNLLSSEEPVDRNAYAEVDVSLTEDKNSLTVGRIGIQAISDDDISNYKVSFVEAVDSPPATSSISASPSEGFEVGLGYTIKWEVDSLTVTIDTTYSVLISDIVASANSDVTRWANLIDKSGTRTVPPIFSIERSELKFSDLPNYKPVSVKNERFYPPSGYAWIWYYGNENQGYDIGDIAYGEWVDDKSKYKYMIVVDGDLSYIGDAPFSIYLTTGLAYDVDKWVTSLPHLHTYISGGYPIEFKIDSDYTLSNQIVEFNHNIFDSKEVSDENILYCDKTEIIEHYLYEQYGNVTGIPDWLAYNHNNFSGKAAINSALLSLQDISDLSNYRRVLNAYYGMPIAPRNSKIVGMYESYGYKVISKSDNDITIDIKPGSLMHPFIQLGSRFFCEGKDDVVVDKLTYPNTITLIDSSQIIVGDLLYVKLRNRFVIKQIIKETTSSAAQIIVFSPEGHEAVQHMVEVMSAQTSGKRFPELIIYNTENLSHNFNGIYHITNADIVEGNEKLMTLTLYKRTSTEEPLYNDYISESISTDTNINFRGFVHIPWPTHKFLYLLMDGDEYFKAYLDAPIDTIFDEEDQVEQYQILARNVSVFNKNIFQDWVQYSHFKRYNGINMESDFLEVTRAVPGAAFGKYFPSRIQETN